MPLFLEVPYSYGSLLAAQTAWFYANQGHVVNHLVLIGSPIDENFLANLKRHKNIKKVIVVDLQEHGDPIYAGISEFDLISSVPVLQKQMLSKKGEGHFYYAHITPDSPKRWKALAERIVHEGVR